MQKKRELVLRARVFVIVDEVDVEQAGLEQGITNQRAMVQAAAWEQPDIAGLKRLCERTGNPIHVKSVAPLPDGKWRVIFLIGKEEANDNNRA
jgi:hypothetical protein